MTCVICSKWRCDAFTLLRTDAGVTSRLSGEKQQRWKIAVFSEFSLSAVLKYLFTDLLTYVKTVDLNGSVSSTDLGSALI